MFKAAVLTMAVTLLCGCEINVPEAGPPQHYSQSVELSKLESARLQLTMGAGELRMSGGSSKLAEADFDYNIPFWKPRFVSHVLGQRADIKVEQPTQGGFMGDVEYKWDLHLNNQVPWDIATNLGAGEAHLDLGSVALRNLEVHMGVGELSLDLRGTPKRSFDVEINGGVGEARVYLPRGAGISATAHGGIGEILVNGLERHGDRWTNQEWLRSASGVSIRLTINGGIGSIRIVAE